MKYILIITLLHGSEGAAIHSIEFNNKAECLAAGNTWLSNSPGSISIEKSALCVARSL